jgi:hypothetical protein
MESEPEIGVRLLIIDLVASLKAFPGTFPVGATWTAALTGTPSLQELYGKEILLRSIRTGEGEANRRNYTRDSLCVIPPGMIAPFVPSGPVAKR